MLKKLFINLSLISLGFVNANAQEETMNKEVVSQENEAQPQELDIETISRAFGHHIGKNLASPEFVNLDLEAVHKGIKEGVEGKDSPLNEADYTKAVSKIQEKQFMHNVQHNLEKAIEFLAQNAKQKHIISLEEGKLQYCIEKQGSGQRVHQHSTPLIHYVGRYLDGKELSSSRESEPIALSLDEAITGLAKGIVGMKEGEKRTLYIHPELGYGTAGSLRPNSLLIFEVEVIKADTPIDQTEALQETFNEDEHHKISMQ
jgi:peptidylprolyl isomerase